MSRVFVIQNQHRGDNQGRLVPKFDISPAQVFGEIHFLLSPTARPFSSAHVIAELRRKLVSYRDGDHLLLLGNPALIGFAVAIAASANHGRVSLLQWDGTQRTYVAIAADLRAEDAESDYQEAWRRER